MNINTKYDVGYTFWVPRVAKRYKDIEIYHEGHHWYRSVDYFDAYVKHKKIVEIEINIKNNSTVIRYYVLDVTDSSDGLSSVYREDQITSYSEEQAFDIALEYMKQNKEYFGS